MNQVRELIELPDPAVHPLVHPLDVAGARPLFRKTWLITMLGGPAVGLGLMAVVWFFSDSFVIPLLAGAVVIGSGAVAGRFYRDEAWAFIPRKRQDRGRPLPRTWQLAEGLVVGCALVASVSLIAVRLGRSDVPMEVREVTFGMALGAGLLVAVDLAVKWRTTPAYSFVAILPVLLGLAACSIIAYRSLFDGTALTYQAPVVWSAVAMLGGGGGYMFWQRLSTDRGRN